MKKINYDMMTFMQDILGIQTEMGLEMLRTACECGGCSTANNWTNAHPTSYSVVRKDSNNAVTRVEAEKFW